MMIAFTRAVVVSVLVFAAICIPAAANSPPNTPTITEPSLDGQIVNAEDVHMECAAFSDPDPGDTHACTDWQIWVASPAEMIWSISCITGVERVHCHLGDGAFQGSYAGRASLLPSVNYLLRCRHKDSSGDSATQWSLWGGRYFTTGPASSVFPLQTDDVATSPLPAWTDSFGTPIILSGGASPPSVRIESPTGALLLDIHGDDGSANQIINPSALPAHVALRIHALAGTSQSLVLPESNLGFTDDDGIERTIYLPAMSLAPAQEAYLWVSANGATYVAQPAQSQPDFSTLARGAPVPWGVFQPGYKVEVVASGFQLPVNIAFVPNPGSNPTDPYFYVTELYGTIKIVRRDGIVGIYATGLLNYASTGAFPGSGEQGLAGIAIDPATGDIFAGMLYDSAPPNGNHYPKVVRFHSNDGGLTAATQTIVLNMVGETQGQSHQISNFSFGPDGKLYVHMGDGFDATKGQDLTSFRGKILRLNLDGTAPSDNPFYNASDGITARDYVYAYGLRNPFGGAWRAADGAHYEIENGPSVDRFVKVVPARNYLYNGSDASMANFAIYNWNPSRGPVNGAFIQPTTFGGSQFPAAKMGHLFVSESGPTWGTGPQPLGKRISEFVLDASGNLVSGPTTLVEYNGSGKASCVGLTAGPDGLYFTDLYKDVGYVGASDAGAHVLRVKFVGTADFTADVASGPAPLTVHFTDASNAPSPSAWSWSFGDGATSTSQNPTHIYLYQGVYNVRLSVTTPDGIVVSQKTAFIRVGTIPKIAIIGGTIPAGAADAAIADHLRVRGFVVTAYDDDPANRPSAATLGAQNNLVMVSSTITGSNVAGQFRTVNVPLMFWEQSLLRTDREALASGGFAVTNSTTINILNNTHPITAGLPAGNVDVFSPAVNMSIGNTSIAPTVSLLATRAGAATDYSLMAANAGASLLAGYVAPARRVFLFLEDSGWLSSTPAAQQIFDQATCWSMGLGAPVITMPPDQSVYTGDMVTFTATVTSTPPAAMQWRHNSLELADAGRFAGTNSPVLAISSVRVSDAGPYDLVATTPCGAATSAAVTLMVRVKGDANCDNSATTDDVTPFILALLDPAAYAAAYPSCPIANCDMNRDNSIDGNDISEFVATLAH